MSKHKLEYCIKKSKEFPVWILLVISSFFFIAAAFSLRTNNQNMIKLRDAVFTADEQSGNVETALKELRQYVYSHMNTDLAAGENSIRPPIQLKYRYERLVETERAKTGTSADVYGDAQRYCEQTQPTGYSGSTRLDCIRTYVDNNGGANVEDVSIPDDLYKFDFASPRWSPDLAGWSLVLGSIFFLLFLIRLLTEYAVRSRVRH